MTSQAHRRLVIGTTTPKIRPGGIPSFIDTAKSLARYRNTVFLEWTESEGDRQLSLGRFNRRLLKRTLISQLRVLIAGQRFEEIEVHSIRTGLSALIFYRRKCIFFYHGPGFQEAAVEGAGRFRRLFLYLIENFFLSGLKGYLTASEAFKLRLRENHGVPLNLIEVMRPSTTLDRAEYADTIRQKLEEARKSGILHCIICRRLVQRVGVLEFLAEFAKIRELTNIQISIVGQGPLEDEVRQACSIDDRVVFLGALSDAERDEVYAQSLFNLVPTLHLEGLGMVIYEGIKYGTVPLSTTVGGMPELIDELRAGRYFNTIDTLVRSISLATVEKELARQDALAEMEKSANPLAVRA
ncbi:glycosyltransferase family 4 protein [Sulfitobacter sp. 1A10445]|uniref:glycosyltransferase family 4 protein n=1 Tax=unclassified Sulfitobacter TaxID=196795 RepID=UPI003745DDA7